MLRISHSTLSVSVCIGNAGEVLVHLAANDFNHADASMLVDEMLKLSFGVCRVVCLRMAVPSLWLHIKPLMSSLLRGQEDSAWHIIQRQQQSDRLGPLTHVLLEKYDSVTQCSMFPVQKSGEDEEEEGEAVGGER